MQNELNLQQWKYEKEIATLQSLTTTNKSEESAAYRELQQDLFMKDRDLRNMEVGVLGASMYFIHGRTLLPSCRCGFRIFSIIPQVFYGIMDKTFNYY